MRLTFTCFFVFTFWRGLEGFLALNVLAVRDRQRERETDKEIFQQNPSFQSLFRANKKATCEKKRIEFRVLRNAGFFAEYFSSFFAKSCPCLHARFFFENTHPTTDGGLQNESSDGIHAHCIHLLARLAPICMLSLVLINKISAAELSREVY